VAQKDLTEAYARDIDGVKSVKNELVVKTPSAPQQTVGEIIDDVSITSQVKYALLTHRSTSAIKTKIETKDGIVAITGEAASDAEKAFVTKLTEGVRGVKSVNNTMTVKS
jgi:osmotically-inducible protein OsmY